MTHAAKVQTHFGQGNLPADLLKALAYLNPEEIRLVERAYAFGAEAHAGQLRLSGERFISHPVAVAGISAELGLDAATIVACLLHDVLEDTAVTKQEIKRGFGGEVAEIVDGVSKITHLKAESHQVVQAESFQKMLLAMARDLRVILVKLADRLHNMRTLQYQSADNRRRIARETLQIYAPIAQRLGMDNVRRELEDIGFANLYPFRQKILADMVERKVGQRIKIMNKACETIAARLKLADIPHEIASRRKNAYSVYRKMHRKRLHFSEVLDILAIRIIVDNVDDCYRTLGLIHSLYKPRPGYFKDYIALPKANGYQSLHTVLFGPQGVSLEVQMRTREMNEVSEYGIAAHVAYKTDAGLQWNMDNVQAKEWVEGLAALRRQTGDSVDFLENLKGGGLVADEVYVFTPEGNIITLPRGATALDFAFAVHTDLGLRCQKVIVNQRLAELNHKLQSGQTVQVLAAKEVCPHPGWLNFAVTAKARLAIRNQLKHLHKNAATELGKRLLNESLKALDTRLDDVEPKRMNALLKVLGLDHDTDLFAEIGLGNQMPALMARRLLGEKNRLWRRSSRKSKSLPIKGTEGLAITYAKCCCPIPGDQIVGVMNPGKGLVVHRDRCNNMRQSVRHKNMQILLEWSSDRPPEQEFPAAIRVRVQHKRGMLAVIAGQIAKTQTNIENISFTEPAGAVATMTLVISVTDDKHLKKVMSDIRIVSKSIQVERVK